MSLRSFSWRRGFRAPQSPPVQSPTSDALARAIRDRKVVTFTYHGHPRVVEPHTLGVMNRTGNLELAGYQTGGGSRRGGIPDWRLYMVSEIQDLAVLEEAFPGPRPGYNPNDSRMREIWAGV